MDTLILEKESDQRILLVGYGGADNTGADIRIKTIIDDILEVFDDQASITVATVDCDKTARLLPDSHRVQAAPIPYLYIRAIRRLVDQHDVVILVEGSTFKDNWSSSLLYLFLWAAYCGQRQGKPTVAYAVDAGRLGPLNRRLTRFVASGMDLLVVRTDEARRRLHEIGLTNDVKVTTDTAFRHRRLAPGGRRNDDRPMVGLAPIEFNWWPVRMRPFGPAEFCYHWPYYHTWNRHRAERSAELIRAWGSLVDHVVTVRGWRPHLIAMEALDQRICEQIVGSLPRRVAREVTTTYAGMQSPFEVVDQLRQVDYLVTSRYHACVLSMEAAVPQAALYHDERLESIYREMGFDHLAHEYNGIDTADVLIDLFEQIVTERDELQSALRLHLEQWFLPRCVANKTILAQWADQVGLRTKRIEAEMTVVGGGRLA